MTIEVNRAGSAYILRINPHNPRLVDRRLNQHRSRWEPWFYYDSAEQAAAALWEIEHVEEEQENGNHG